MTRVFTIVAAMLLTACGGLSTSYWDSGSPPAGSGQKQLAALAQTARFPHPGGGGDAGTDITYPYEGAVFPAEMAAPRFLWTSAAGEDNENGWLMRLDFEGRGPSIFAFSREPRWEIPRRLWERITAHERGETIGFSVVPAPAGNHDLPAGSRVTFSISSDPLSDTVLFRQVPLPFPVGDLSRLRWRLADIASYKPPPVIMRDIKVCASCHSVSADGRLLAMEMNYGNDSGAQFITPVRKRIHLTDRDFFSWDDYPKKGILPKSRGLFGRMSPSGRYALASVNEISLALVTNTPEFSQVFTPTFGILGWHRRADRSLHPLPGADDYRYVHATPAWSRDERKIAFARSETHNEFHDDIRNPAPRYVDMPMQPLNDRYPIQFDICILPFNDGKGGEPVLLKGASQNGMSNYFPRFSPDGRWIVYTRSRTGIMLQPDAELYIVPASGGKARRMTCNRSRFNSWHSWSSDGRWLLFTSKVNTPFTEIFVTHVDENGMDAPPVRLSRLSEPDLAANVPEFVPLAPGSIEIITVEEGGKGTTSGGGQ
jgi:hypothetical protein